ncbi:MAG: HD domain-containing protein [Desulfobulbaceae bacterium]|uniref:HD domain-containing protein n=1 Tax=Candidatus Desulfatifera sulfidica TaxID=2841691 RepID=A0A8J6NCE4_9BACT|nr:HD domain-containing protein [Candidatus Desulfatifera sulfidica]
MLDNIRAHSFMVAHVADALYCSLSTSSTGRILPPEQHSLILAGALLHDIAKTPCLNNACDHARLGQDLCQQLGYPEVGEIVREHVILRDFSLSRYKQGQFLIKELVYYADKRVRHDEVVTLHQRMDYIIERYGNNDSARHLHIQNNFQLCQTLEEHLFTHINFPPKELASHLNGQLFSPAQKSS